MTCFPILMVGVLASCFAQTSIASEQSHLPEVEYIGTFSNMTFTEEHAYGSDVELWKCGGELLGLFSHSEGLIGDTPTGILENVSYNPDTRALSFRAKLTIGVSSAGKGISEPSRDLFVFTGFLSKKGLEGKLIWTDQNTTVTWENESVVLTEQPSDDNPAEFFKIKTVADWVVYAVNVLRRLGPKW